MKFALLGAEPNSLALARAALDAGHSLVWQEGLTGDVRERLPWLPSDELAESWEDLFDEQTADAVIIGRHGADPDRRTIQLQQLVRLGRPVLATFPLSPSVLAFHECELARSDGQAPLWHYNPLLENPLADSLARWAQHGHPDCGSALQILCQRFLDDRSRDSVLRQFACDVELLGRVVGRLDRVGAHGAAHTDVDFSALSVQLNGERGLPAGWSVLPPADDAAMRLTIVCEHGRVVADYDSGDRPTYVGAGKTGAENSETPLAVNAARRCVDSFCQAVMHGGDDSTWPSALRAMELADTIEISLRRGRVIDVHSQQLTEQLSFRGMMSAVGCGLLLVAPPLMILLGWIAGKLGAPVAQYWPHALFAALALFLGFQLLPKLLLTDKEPDDNVDQRGA